MTRRFEVLRSGKWEECNFQDIKAGDSFRAFEQEDKIIFTGRAVIFVAATDPIQKNGKWFIEIIEENKDGKL